MMTFELSVGVICHVEVLDVEGEHQTSTDALSAVTPPAAVPQKSGCESLMALRQMSTASRVAGSYNSSIFWST